MELQLVFAIFILLLGGAKSAVLNFTNNCPYNIWPAISSNPSATPLPHADSGFFLPPNSFKSITIPTDWSGRMWARTLCANNGPRGTLNCTTGDCRTGAIECGPLPIPPVTFIDINSASHGNLDSYDVSVLVGFNVPASVAPLSGSGCRVLSCTADVNANCPPELRVVGGDGGKTVACMSACQAFGDNENCCSGEFAGRDKCKPTKYNKFFKDLCPLALTHFFDQSATCDAGSDYLVKFCDVA